MAAKFDPSRSRAARPSQNVQDTSGRDFQAAQEQHRGTRAASSRFQPEFFGVTPERSFSSRELAAMDNDKLLDTYANGTRTHPFEVTGVPTPKSMSEYIEFVDEYVSGALGKTNAYNPKTANVGGNVTAVGEGRSGDPSVALQPQAAPAPQSLVPTSTINPERPRTLSAGYEIEVGHDTGKLTVQFRDGTWYNYYEVTPTTWDNFKSAVSKGRFIVAVLDSHPRGFATGGQAGGRKALHKAARVGQRHLHARRGQKMMRAGNPVQVSRQSKR